MEEIRMNIKNNKNCKITINDEEIAVSEKEKTADEMFNKLGFTEIRNEYNYFTYETKGGKNGYIRFDNKVMEKKYARAKR